MRVDQCVSVVRAVEVPVFVCFLSGCSYVTEVGGAIGFVRLALKVVMENNGDFVEVILHYTASYSRRLGSLSLEYPDDVGR